MAATITPPPKKLQENITLTFKNIKNSNNKKKCMFWNMLDDSSIGWSGEGCYVKSTDAYQTECTCNHLTHFAVLLDTSSGTETADISARHETTFIPDSSESRRFSWSRTNHVSCWDWSDWEQGRLRHSGGPYAVLFDGRLLLDAGRGNLPLPVYCKGLQRWQQVKNVPWNFMGCWMSSANGLIWIFIVFVVLIEFFNILILGRVIKEMVTMQQEKDKRSEQIRLGVKACIVMIPLLGISWLFGLLAPLHKAFAYIFTILNSSQGFVIFLLHCVRNSEVRARLRRRIQAIFPAMDVGTSTKRTSVMPSEVNEDSTAIAAPRKIKVHPLTDGEKTKRVSNKTSM